MLVCWKKAQWMWLHLGLNANQKMLNLSFNLRNPFSDRWETLGHRSWQISRYKWIELQFDRGTDIVGLTLRITPRQDHAGAFVSVSLLSYEAMFHFYDSRHWDYETNSYKVYD